MILIFGHKSPDTDATGSPIIWQWLLREIRGLNARAVLLGEPNLEARFVLRRWGLETPEIIDDLRPETEVVVVDTNNPAELPPGIADARIIEVIDHHLLSGGLGTIAPVPVTIRPLACTATVMHQLMGPDAACMPAEIQGVMLSCILSDTLEFRSPTTTAVDRELAESLAASLSVDIPSYAAEMFAAKSDMSAYSDAELLTVDAKSYEIGGKRIRISVLETTAPKSILERKPGLLEAMDSMAKSGGIDQILLFVVDILKQEATLLVPNEFTRRIAEKSFSAEVTGDTVRLPGIMSRKKQIIPNLSF
ncbi:MAG: manganese-dependent inorganic pyrophosphatase [Rhodobacteraceae bacterium]|nr:manganese-dependent inorganic pyrophosphatase [Paracoccaceae bacterium]